MSDGEDVLPMVAGAGTLPSTMGATPVGPAQRGSTGRSALVSTRRARRAAAGEVSGDPVLASLVRLEGLVAILARVALKPVLESELKERASLVIYEMTGESTVKEISAAAGVSVGTVSNTWTRWARLGLVVKSGTGYRRSF